MRPAEPSPEPSPEPRLGPFRLIQPIGRGASGEVWAAEYVPQGTPVAVKLLDIQRAPEPRELEAFRNEVRSVAGLDHPNVIAILEHGVVPEGLEPRLRCGAPYLVMELATGGSLKPWCGRLEWPDLERVLLDLLSALGHAHARGVIHRDLKPGNVLVGGMRPGVKLTDFGLAQLFEESSGAEDVAGTPAYMAPEQFQSGGRELGPWTDLYALGCTAWALVSGSPPYGSDSPLEARRGHLFRPLPALELAVSAPVAFEGWLRRLLEKDPLRRFRRAADAAHALSGLGRDMLPPTVTLPPPTPEVTSTTQPGTLRSHTFSELSLRSSLSITPAETTLAATATSGLADLTWQEEREAGQAGEARSAFESDHSDTIVSFDSLPPVPEDWRGGARTGSWVDLGPVGLKIFGLRAIPLVDREAERDHLWAELRAVCAERAPRAVVLQGAAGCGKTRLAEWLGERAHELGVASVMRAWHSPVGGPTEGLAGMVARAVRWPGGSLDDAQRRVGSALVALGATPARDEAAALAAVIHGEQVGGVRFRSPSERYAAIRRFAVAFSAERPVVLSLDDVAWGLDALRFARELLEPGETPLPALILLTVRAEALPERPAEAEELDRLLAHPRCSRLDVGPLSEDHHAALVQSLLGLETELAAQVADRTAGNPLFAVQLVGDWVQRGLLEPGAHGFKLVAGATAELPASLAVVWEERLARLLQDRPDPGPAREAIELAAALGLDVDSAEWEAVCQTAGLTPPWDLVEGLIGERLARAGAEGPRVAWSFVHGMLRETLLAGADRAGRTERYHRCCAAVLLTEDQQSAAINERLGRHLLAGGDPSASLAPLLRAANARMSGGDYRQAELLLQLRESGLQRCGMPAGSPDHVEGELVWIQLLVFLGRMSEAEEHTEALLKVTQDGGPQHLAARFFRAYLYRVRGFFDQAWAEFTAIDEPLRQSNDRILHQRLKRERGRILLERGDLVPAAEHLQEALALARADGDADREGFALRDLAIVHLHAGRTALALQHVRQARARFSRSGNRWGIADALNMLGEMDREEGRLASADARYRESIERFRQLGSYDAIIPQLNLAMVTLIRGELTELGYQADATLKAARRVGNPRLVAIALCIGVAWAAGVRDWRRWAETMAELNSLDPGGATASLDVAVVLEQAAELARKGARVDLARDALALAEAVFRAVQRTADADRVSEARAALEGSATP